MSMPARNSLLDHVFTIPEAQTKIFDLEWQSAFYTVFHQTKTARLLHAICMAPIVISLYVLTSYIGLGGQSLLSGAAEITVINGAFVVMIVSIIWYLIMDVKVGLVALPFVVAFWLVANTANYLAGDLGLPIALAVLVIASMVQTISHQPEMVPPPHSGSSKFVQFKYWVQNVPFLHRLRVGLMFPWFSVVELISSPRLFPIQLLRLMHKFGYKTELEALTEKRARRVLETGNYDAYYEV